MKVGVVGAGYSIQHFVCAGNETFLFNFSLVCLRSLLGAPVCITERENEE